jgi:hypothetical protein
MHGSKDWKSPLFQTGNNNCISGMYGRRNITSIGRATRESVLIVYIQLTTSNYFKGFINGSWKGVKK